MEDCSVDGVWFLDDSGKSFAGRLEISQGQSILTLPREALGIFVDNDLLFPDDQLFAHTFPTIMGTINDASIRERQVALFGCHLAFLGMDDIRLRSTAATIGAIAPTEDSFNQFTLEFDWLRAWLRPEPLAGSWQGLDEPLELRIGEQPLAAVEVDDATVELLLHHRSSIGPYDVSVSRHVYFRVTLRAPTSWLTIINFWQRTFQDFLTVAIGKPVQSTGSYLRAAEAPHQGRVELVTRSSRRAAEDDASESSLMSYTSPVLLSGEEYLANFEQLTRGWLTAEDKYHEAIIRLTAPAGAVSIYLENRSAFIVQALEAYFNATFTKNQKKDLSTDEHKQRVTALIHALEQATKPPAQADLDWARRVLSSRNTKSWSGMVDDVLAASGELGSAIAKALPKFAHDAESMRHAVSHPPRVHGGADAGRRTNLSLAAEQQRMTKLHYTTELLEWTLRVLILEACGHDAAARASGLHNVLFCIGELQRVAAE